MTNANTSLAAPATVTLTVSAYADYEVIRESAYADYEVIADKVYADYKVGSLTWDEYDKIRYFAYDAYEVIRESAYADYEATQKAARDAARESSAGQDDTASDYPEIAWD